MDYNPSTKEVFVICRPQDVPETLRKSSQSYIIGTTQTQELTYYFIDIYGYIKFSIFLLTPDSRKYFYKELLDYINDTNTAENVKKYFKRWHSENNFLL